MRTTRLGDLRRSVSEPVLEAPARTMPRRRVRWAALIAGLALGAASARDVARCLERRWLETAPPDVDAVDVYALCVDATPVPLTISAGWQKVPYVATAAQVRSDVTLWLRMHFEDWDTVPASLRAEGLDAMFARYRDLLATPRVWDGMTADDWDRVPQPVRALAFRRMAAYWSGHYRLGADHGIAPRTAADAVAAVLMTESWFEHRAVNVNRWGNRDLGLAQAADATRARMSRLHRAGVVDVHFQDEDYFDPWKATRFAVLWMGLLLDETGGDLDAAIRAYHRGTRRALQGEGEAYLETTRRRLAQLNPRDDDTRSLGYLRRCDRALASGLATSLPPGNTAGGRVVASLGPAAPPRPDARPSEDQVVALDSESASQRR